MTSAAIQTYYHRTATTLLLRYASIYPAVVITGPRQSGKTTLARKTFPHLPYVSLETLDVQSSFAADPRKFLSRYIDGAIFDEVQYTPSLLSYLQEIIDSSPQDGRFIITGSQNFTLSQTVTQSLAGRVGMITLLPLSSEELGNSEADTLIADGGYPRLHIKAMSPHEFYPSYINSYIERDVRHIKNITDLSLFQSFLKICAGRTGQLINVESMAQQCGISPKTAKEWLNVLEASYIIFFLRPYHTNFNKRLTKMAKLYFYDTGVACSLLGIQSAEQADSHYAAGPLFENLVILELIKGRLNRGMIPELYFWRDSNDKEIDVIDEWNGRTNLIEIKSRHTLNTADSKNLKAIKPLFPQAHEYIVYAKTECPSLGDITLLSLADVHTIFNP